MESARHLLVSVAQPTKLQLLAESDGTSGLSRTANATPAIDPIQLSSASRRAVFPLPGGGAITAFSFSSESGVGADGRRGARLASTPRLLSDASIFPAIPPLRYHATLVPRAIGRLCLFTMVAAFAVPAFVLRKLNPVMLAAVCFSLCVLDLASLYSPFTARDLRAFYASGPLQEMAGSNLNGAIWEAARLLDGRGFTVADGLVSWAKMPGYGLMAAGAGLRTANPPSGAVSTTTSSCRVLSTAARWILRGRRHRRGLDPAVAVFGVGLLIAMLPKQLGYTQVDSVIAPIALVILGALCIRLHADQQARPVGLRVDAFVHLTFALWFLMRPDVLPGWAIVSVILHARSPRRLLIPAALVVVIGVGWAGYKMRYTGEFVPTTSTTGASLLCGLWEVPSRFPWTCSDESYFAWVSSHTAFDPKSQAGSNVVVREVFKFWLTFPGHFVFMIDNKLMRCLSGDLWPGIPTDLQQSLFQIVGRAPLVLFFVTVIALAVGAGYQRLRTLLLAWPLFLNAPLFWIMQTSEGRYYGAVGVALLVGAVPLLFEKPFYHAILSRHRATVAVLVCVGVFAATAWPIHDFLLRNDTFRYWTPFLAPSSSSWGVVR